MSQTTRSCRVLFFGKEAGRLTESADGYCFAYDPHWLAASDAAPINVTLPLQAEPFCSATLFPFFDGLLPEGWVLEKVVQQTGLAADNRMGLLLACCRDCIGAVAILPETGSVPDASRTEADL